MKASELMIGDIITFKDSLEDNAIICVEIVAIAYQGANSVLVSIDGDKALDIIELDDETVGIPLTPQILENNGFKPFEVKDTDSVEVIGKWWGRGGSVMVKQYSLTHIGKVFSVKGNYSRIGNIRYVHEFQNALQICGVEKKIKINRK